MTDKPKRTSAKKLQEVAPEAEAQEPAPSKPKKGSGFLEGLRARQEEVATPKDALAETPKKRQRKPGGGRKPAGSVPASRENQFQTYQPPEVRSAVDIYANISGKTKSLITEEALKAYLKEKGILDRQGHIKAEYQQLLPSED